MQRIGFSLEDNDYEDLRRIAFERRTSMAELSRYAIKEYLERQKISEEVTEG